MIFNDGCTDSLQANFLNNIEWEIQYGVFRGKCPLNALCASLIPNFDENWGRFSYRTSPLTGNQKITISWSKDFEHQIVVFYVDEVTKPNQYD